MADTRLLFVCLGNICRSPPPRGCFCIFWPARGSRSTSWWIRPAPGAGMWAGPPIPACAPPPSGGHRLPSRARQIERADLTRFDRILTMDGDNLQAVRAWPRKAEATAQPWRASRSPGSSRSPTTAAASGSGGSRPLLRRRGRLRAGAGSARGCLQRPAGAAAARQPLTSGAWGRGRPGILRHPLAETGPPAAGSPPRSRGHR